VCVVQIGMPSKPKLWILADEDERIKIFRYEGPDDPDLWVEIQFDKTTEHWLRVRCTFNTPGKWHRFEEPIKNHAVAKRKAFEYLLKRTFQAARVT